MKTILNVSTDKGMVKGVVFDKPFDDISDEDVAEAVCDRLKERDVLVFYYMSGRDCDLKKR